MPVCAQCGQENPELARFCLACGAALAPAEPPHEERKLVTVLFTDIVGSTATAEQLDPEDVRARLEPYFARVRTELERFGGTVEKFIGDAVVALFGAPVAHEDDPERALRAAFAVRDGIAELNAADDWLDLHIRTAVHTGEALVVTGARPATGEGMAAGDVMNTAARLQSAAPPDGIVVGELTYAATRASTEYREAEPVRAKGKAEPVRVWEAVALLEPAPRAVATGAPIVGRDEELGALLELWQETVATRRPALALVLGAPGIGKSRLLAELKNRIGGEGNVHRGRCLSYGEGITYWPVSEVLKSVAGILQGDETPTVARKLGELLEQLPTSDPSVLRTIAAAAANLLGVSSSPEGTYATAEIAQSELHWGVRRLLQLLAVRRPLAIMLEDLHWAEPTLLELVEYLVEDGEAPLLLVCSARPELAELARARTVKLEPLPAAVSEQLLAHLLGDTAASASAAETVLRRAGGNPLFLEETVRMLAEEGLRLDVEGGELPVPTSLQALIASRLDRLAQPEKRVAQHAAVVGQVFWPGAVAYVQGGDGFSLEQVHERLDGLERRDIVRPAETTSVVGEREYAFKHVLLRDVAYGALPKGRRAELHVRFADWVETLPIADEFVEIVAYHLEQSCRMAREVARSPLAPPTKRATSALLRAGERAERRGGMREAERFYARGLELVSDDDQAASAECLLRLARPLAALGRVGEATEAAREAAGVALAIGRDDLRAAALIVEAEVDLRQGRATEARHHVDEAVELARRCGDRRLQVRARFARAVLLAEYDGEVEEALEQLRTAVVLAEENDDRALLVEGHLRLGFVHYNGGDLAGAETAFAECIARAGELGSRRDETRATFHLGLIKYLRGDLDEAERLGAEARAALEVTGETFFQIQNLIALAQYALAREELRRAEELLREALPLALEEGGWLAVEVYRLLVETLVRSGRIDEADAALEAAASTLPEEHSYARAALLLGRAYVAAGRSDAGARRLYDDALALLESLNLPIEACQARMSYARALAAAGAADEARVQLEQARETCARIGAAGLAAEIERQLA